MRFSAFLKDKWVFLLSQTAIILFLALLLNVIEISNAANALVCICVLLTTIGALALEFFQKNSFYKQLYQNLEALEKKTLYFLRNRGTGVYRGCAPDRCAETDNKIHE